MQGNSLAVAFNGKLNISMDYSEIRYVLEQWGVPIPEADPSLGGSVRIGKYCTLIQVFGRGGKESWLYYHSAESGKVRMIYLDHEDTTKNKTLYAKNFAGE